MSILVHGVPTNSFYQRLKERKKKSDILVMEGRPHLEGAKIVCRDLLKENIEPTLISDNMVAYCMWKGEIDEVYLFYHQLNSQGAVCRIGSLVVGICAREHKIPVYLYPAGKKTEDFGKARDLFYFNGFRVAPQGIEAYVPLTEHLPWKYITKLYAEEEDE